MRTGGPLSCLLIDLDDFKLVNDRHGHQAGDAVLREVVQALVGEFRAFDRVARYGGDEFVVILPNADLRERRGGRRARARADCARLPSLRRASTGVSASIGVAQWHAPMSTDELLRSLRRGAAALQARGQGPRHARRAPIRLSQRLARRSARRRLCETAGMPAVDSRDRPGDAHVAEQLWRQGHARGRRPQLRDLPPRRAAAALRRRAPAVLAEGPAREPAAHRGQRLGRRPPTSRRSPAGTPRRSRARRSPSRPRAC